MDPIYQKIIRDCLNGYNSLELALMYNMNPEILQVTLESIFTIGDLRVEPSKKGGYDIVLLLPRG